MKERRYKYTMNTVEMELSICNNISPKGKANILDLIKYSVGEVDADNGKFQYNLRTTPIDEVVDYFKRELKYLEELSHHYTIKVVNGVTLDTYVAQIFWNGYDKTLSEFMYNTKEYKSDKIAYLIALLYLVGNGQIFKEELYQ